MTDSSLDDRLGSASRERSYEPGRASESEEVARELLRKYHGYQQHNRPERYDFSEFCDSLIGKAEMLDADELLSSLLSNHEMMTPEHSDYALDWFLPPIIQSLFDAGYNRFTVDLSNFSHLNNPLKGLTGKRERRLELTCRGNMVDFGYSGDYVDLTLFGRSYSTGQHAVTSRFTHHGRIINRAGDYSWQCEFHITEWSAVCTSGRNRECEYYLLDGISEKKERYIRERKLFFEKDNRVFKPVDGEGDDITWEEVLQDEG